MTAFRERDRREWGERLESESDSESESVTSGSLVSRTLDWAVWDGN